MDELKDDELDKLIDEKVKQKEAEEIKSENVNVPIATAQEGLTQMIGKTVNESKDIKSLAKDLTFLAGASKLQQNEEFTKEYQEALATQIINGLKDEGKEEAIKNAAKKQEAANLRAEAFYKGCKPIFELLSIHTAFGLVPMVITVLLLMIPFLLISLVRFIVNSINSIATCISEFKKPAFWLCTIILCVLVTFVLIIASLKGIDHVFGTHILR